MLSNNQIKYINSLKIKKYRQLHKAFIIEGEKGVNDLLKSSIRPIIIFAIAEWLDKYYDSCKASHIEVVEITESELKKASDLVTPNQVIAIAEIPETNTQEIDHLNKMILALDSIRDPGNMGTIIRTADWFGIKNIVCSTDSVDLFMPKVIQSTMGSFSRVQVNYIELEDYFQRLPQNTPIYGALLEGPAITKSHFTHPGVILIGNESNGISRKLIPYVNNPIHIPRFTDNNTDNQAESLNASIANGIICYEICKQLYRNNF